MLDDSQIRAKLREAFRTFALPRTMPKVGGNDEEMIQVDGGRGRMCSVCGELIPTTAVGSRAFTYLGRRVIFMHERCWQLWDEERYMPPGPRQ